MSNKQKSSSVLVLNRAWIPIHIITDKRAVSLIFQDTALALDQDFNSYSFSDWVSFSKSDGLDYPHFNTVSKRIFIPEIIVLKEYDRLPMRDVKYSRQTLFERDGFRCGYCGQGFRRDELTVDHIVPRSRGGTTSWENTVSCCETCNRKKADHTLAESGMRLLIKPKKPRWINPATGGHKTNSKKSWRKFMSTDSVDLG